MVYEWWFVREMGVWGGAVSGEEQGHGDWELGDVQYGEI